MSRARISSPSKRSLFEKKNSTIIMGDINTLKKALFTVAPSTQSVSKALFDRKSDYTLVRVCVFTAATIVRVLSIQLKV